jgi:hypothetical protein
MESIVFAKRTKFFCNKFVCGFLSVVLDYLYPCVVIGIVVAVTAAFVVVVPAAFVISNIEIAYNLLDFGREMEQMVLSMPRLFLKCNSYSNSSASVASQKQNAGSSSHFFSCHL